MKDKLHEREPKRTAWQSGFDTDFEFYTWLEKRPVAKEAFHRYLEGQVNTIPRYVDAVNFETEFFSDLKSNDVAFIDIGGGQGHQCEVLKSRFPKMQGRVILQDLASVLEVALPVKGMEKMQYDYLTEQPIKGMLVLHSVTRNGF